MASATRLLVVEAAPKALVEGVFGAMGAVGALYASPPLALYFVGHETVMAQLVGLSAAVLASKRDASFSRENDVREEWVKDVADTKQTPMADPELTVCQIEAADSQLALERVVDASQLCVLSSYVVTSGALIEKTVLKIDAEKYQKVMGFAGGAMQAAQEVSQCAEKLGRGTELMAMLHKLEDAKKPTPLVNPFDKFHKTTN